MKALKKIWDLVSTVVVVCIVILALLLVGVRIAGYDVYTILSGSMEPTYHVGSIIYVKSVDYRDLTVGDPITFLLDENTVATHRIVEIIPDEEDPTVLRFRTKGDANANADGGLVHYKNIIGRPDFTIPYLGYVANYIQNPPGTYVAIAFGIIFLLLMFLPDLIGGDEKKDGAEKKAKSEKSVKKQKREAPAPNAAETAPEISETAPVRRERTERAAPARRTNSTKQSGGKHSRYVGKH